MAAGAEAETRLAAPSGADGALGPPAFGLSPSPSEERVLDLLTDHPMLPREHLVRWLGVSEGRISQLMRSLVDTWGLIERHGRRGCVRYTLSDGGIRHVAHRDRADLPASREVWSTVLTRDRRGRRRHLRHRIDTRSWSSDRWPKRHTGECGLGRGTAQPVRRGLHSPLAVNFSG